MISTLTLPLARAFGEEKALEVIAQAGFEAIDYSMHLYALDDPCYTKPLNELIGIYERLRRVLERNGLVAGQFHAPYYTHGEQEEERMGQATIRAIYAAAALGSPYVVVHPILPLATKTDTKREQFRGTNMRYYTRLIPYLKETGVKLAVENMFSEEEGVYIPTAMSDGDDMIWSVDTMNGIAGEELFAACLDVGHANVLGLDPAQMARALGSRLQLLHLHDNWGLEDSHQLPFLGTIDYTTFVQALHDIGYRGNINMEAHGFLSCFDRELMPKAAGMAAAVARHIERMVAAPGV